MCCTGQILAVESTLSSPSYARRFAKWSRLGYRTTLHFIELPSAEYAIERVARRVAAGGHAVGETERWYHWRSDEGGLRLADQSEK